MSMLVNVALPGPVSSLPVRSACYCQLRRDAIFGLLPEGLSPGCIFSISEIVPVCDV